MKHNQARGMQSQNLDNSMERLIKQERDTYLRLKRAKQEADEIAEHNKAN